MLRTRSPRAHTLYCYRMLRVRLACVKHAASVRSEPGSNSRLSLGVSTVTMINCYDRNELLNRSVFSNTTASVHPKQKLKPNGFWHVSSDCQRAGHPRPAGRTTDEPRYYRNCLRESTRYFRYFFSPVDFARHCFCQRFCQRAESSKNTRLTRNCASDRKLPETLRNSPTI